MDENLKEKYEKLANSIFPDVTETVEDGAMSIARARQVNKPGYAKVLEEKRMKIYNERNKK